MRQTRPISLGFNSNKGRDPAAGSATLTNCYAELAGEEQKSLKQLWSPDGLELFYSSPETIGTRAMLDVDGVIYKVRGRGIFVVEPSGAETQIAGIASDAPVTIARNRRETPQIGICSQDGQYIVIEGRNATDCSASLRGGANSITFLNGYFIFTHNDGSVSHTEEDDAKTIDPLAYAVAESSPDPAIRGMVKQREFLAFGTRSIEFFGDAGGDPFVFSRNQAIDIGCAASGSCAEVDQTIMFLASDLTVRILNGYQAVRVSTHSIERTIAADPYIATLTALTWTRDGHTFYCLSGKTFSLVYDLATQTWHNRESYGDRRWLASCMVQSNGELFVGAYNSGNLYRMKRDVHSEGDRPMVVKIVTPPVHGWPSRLAVSEIHLDIVPGVGAANSTLSGSLLAWANDVLGWGNLPLSWGEVVTTGDPDPEVMLRLSYDGGASWSAERRQPLGRQGDRLRRVVFRRNGTTRQHGVVLEISCSAAVMRGFLGAAVVTTARAA
jgi:hypothetical protein